MNLRPIHDRIVIKRSAVKDRTEGGLFIPDNAKEKSVRGTVVALGEGKQLDGGSLRPMQLKKGDEVLFDKYAGTEIKIEGEPRVLLNEDSVIGVFDPEGKLHPLYDHVLIRPDKGAEKYGSIIIPDSAREKVMQGTVLACGKGMCHWKTGAWIPLSVKTGDRVLFGSNYAGKEVEIGGEKLLVMRQDEIAAVLE